MKNILIFTLVLVLGVVLTPAISAQCGDGEVGVIEQIGVQQKQVGIAQIVENPCERRPEVIPPPTIPTVPTTPTPTTGIDLTQIENHPPVEVITITQSTDSSVSAASNSGGDAASSSNQFRILETSLRKASKMEFMEPRVLKKAHMSLLKREIGKSLKKRSLKKLSMEIRNLRRLKRMRMAQRYNKRRAKSQKK